MKIASIPFVVGIVLGLSISVSLAQSMRFGNDFVKINDSAFITAC